MGANPCSPARENLSRAGRPGLCFCGDGVRYHGKGVRDAFGLDRCFDYCCHRRHLFWAIDKFATDRRLAQLLKLLVVLICLAAILQRVLPLLGVYI